MALEMRTLASASSMDFLHRYYRESVQKALRVIELAGRVDTSYSEVAARYYAAISLLGLGDLEEAHQHARLRWRQRKGCATASGW